MIRTADDRTETTRESGLHYAPGEPVLVTVVRRERRLSVHDSGAALEKAGKPRCWRAVAEQLERSLDVNISKRGVVWLPVVAAGPGLERIAERIASASLALYQDLLEIET